MFRSEDMSLVLLCFHKSSLKFSVDLLGCESLLHFVPLNDGPVDTLFYTNQIRFCERILSKISSLASMVEDDSESCGDDEEDAKNDLEDYEDASQNIEYEKNIDINLKGNPYNDSISEFNRISDSVYKNGYNVSGVSFSSKSTLNESKHLSSNQILRNLRAISGEPCTSTRDHNRSSFQLKSTSTSRTNSNTVTPGMNLPSYSTRTNNSSCRNKYTRNGISSVSKSFFDYNEACSMVCSAYDRLFRLNDIRRNASSRLEEAIEDVACSELLQAAIACSTPLENIDEAQKMLDVLCVSITATRVELLKKVLKNHLRRNVLIAEARIDSRVVVVAFTHGESALSLMERLSKKLSGRVVSKEKVNCLLKAQTKLSQLKRLLRIAKRAINSEKRKVKICLLGWKKAVLRELRVLKVMNGFLYAEGCELVAGKAFVRSKCFERLLSVCNIIQTKHGYVSVHVLKDYSPRESLKSIHICQAKENIERNSRSVIDNTDAIDGLNRPDEDRTNIIQNSHNRSDMDAHMHSSVSNTPKNQFDDKHYTENDDRITRLGGNFNPGPVSSLIDNANTYVLENTYHNDAKGCERGNGRIENTSCESPQSMEELFGKASKDIPDDPPTYFPTTKFTQAFQDVCNVYGVPTFKELNPAAFYVTTFPFMFGCMFGDIFHGLILFIISLYLIKKEDTIKIPESLKLIFDGRYIMLMCSLWAIFFGTIYNDFASIPIGFKTTTTYFLGINPGWHHSENSTTFMNSAKMKLSILIGFCHMSFGILLNFLNCAYKNDKITMLCVTVPQTLGFCAFVGYLCFLIVFKWVVALDFSIVTVFVDMFTSFEINNEVFSGQGFLQKVLVTIIALSIPWMFLAKPVVATMNKQKENRMNKYTREHNPYATHQNLNENLNTEHQSQTTTCIAENSNSPSTQSSELESFKSVPNISDRSILNGSNQTMAETPVTSNLGKVDHKKSSTGVDKISDDYHEEETLTDVWMHSAIETIEFGIGLISNTSSYLRLWAISLAHAQLSQVLHSMTIGQTNLLIKIISFPIYVALTLGLLVGLEGLSACLHALRLNWIEFNGRFYSGKGYIFEPLNYDITEDD